MSLGNHVSICPLRFCLKKNILLSSSDTFWTLYAGLLNKQKIYHWGVAEFPVGSMTWNSMVSEFTSKDGFMM